MDRVRVVGRLLRRLAVLAAALAAAGATAQPAEVAVPIAPGVNVGDIVMDGLTAEPARALLARDFARPLVLTHAGRRWEVAPSALGAQAGVRETVRRALAAEPGARIELPVRVDETAIRALVDRLARTVRRAPRDARLVGLDARLRPRFAPAEAGYALDRARAAAAIRTALLAGRRHLEVPVAPVEPKRRARDLGPIVVIRRESNVLTLYDGPRVVREFRVATGTWRYPTPLGTFRVVDKQYHPWWYPPASDWARGLDPIPPGPGNPLGTRWMGLNVYGVGIHGTPDAASIGYSASHGCIRMHVWEAEWLFERVELGTPVFVVSA